MLLLVQYTLIFASVLVLVALGGCFSEHSGVINIGLEGIMVMGALGGALMMKYIPAGMAAPLVILLVVLASVLIGMIFSMLLGVAAIKFNADQTLVGTALNLLGPAAAVVLVRAINTAESVDNVSSTVAYGHSKKAFVMNIGSFEFNWFMLIALLVLIAAYIVLYKTKFGLRLCACGEHPQDGHAACVGGCIVDSGNFDWEAYGDKFKGLTTPDETYHGIVYTEKFGKGAYITKATVQLMRDLGSVQSPQNAFLLNLGLETLHLRVQRHCENAQKVAEYLVNHEKVAWVNYAGLPDNKYHALAQKYMPNGTCGVISFGLKGGRDASVKMMDQLKLAAIVTHVADARTSVLHPASHTHRQMNEQELLEAGVQPDLIRFSVGIENADDIIADLEQALATI